MIKIFIETVGYVAASLTTVAYLPQALKIIKLKKTDEISLAMYILACSGVFLWLIYGLLIGDLPLILANGITLLLGLTVLFFKIKFG